MLDSNKDELIDLGITDNHQILWLLGDNPKTVEKIEGKKVFLKTMLYDVWVYNSMIYRI